VKILGLCLCIVLNVLANDGKILFEKHCVSCHTPFVPMLKLKENFLEHNNTLLKLKAPTLNQLSYRLKQRIGDPKGDEEMHRMEVTAFMSDYVYHPDKSKSVCLDEVMLHFKTMPSLKGKVSEDALDRIGEYLYDFDEEVIKSKGIQFEGFDVAVNLAQKEHKLIMIEAMTSTCHFCRKMQREVMIDKEVVQMIKKSFVPVAIDIHKNSLPLGIKVEVTPSFIFIDAQKNVLMNVPGAWGKKDFLALLKEAKLQSKRRKNEK